VPSPAEPPPSSSTATGASWPPAGPWGGQAVRYAQVWIAGLALNCALLSLLVELGLAYPIAKVLAAVAIGSAVNFPLHRHYAFR